MPVLAIWAPKMNGVCSARVNTLPSVVGSPVQFEVSSGLVLALFSHQIQAGHLLGTKLKSFLAPALLVHHRDKVHVPEPGFWCSVPPLWA